VGSKSIGSGGVADDIAGTKVVVMVVLVVTGNALVTCCGVCGVAVEEEGAIVAGTTGATVGLGDVLLGQGVAVGNEEVNAVDGQSDDCSPDSPDDGLCVRIVQVP
jgi:hypothetical protein